MLPPFVCLVLAFASVVVVSSFRTERCPKKTKTFAEVSWALLHSVVLAFVVAIEPVLASSVVVAFCCSSSFRREHCPKRKTKKKKKAFVVAS